MDTELLALSDDITRHPEIGFVERRSIEKLRAARGRRDRALPRAGASERDGV
jgi:hypothetical protein